MRKNIAKPKHHPIVEKWLQQHHAIINPPISAKVQFNFRPNKLAHRQYRILSAIFFAIDERGISIHPHAWRLFYFKSDNIYVPAYIYPSKQQPPNTRADMAKLEFLLLNHQLGVRETWTEEDAPLEDQLEAIAAGIQEFIQTVAGLIAKAQEWQLEQRILALQRELETIRSAE